VTRTIFSLAMLHPREKARVDLQTNETVNPVKNCRPFQGREELALQAEQKTSQDIVDSAC
jgi:hypothetical protein